MIWIKGQAVLLRHIWREEVRYAIPLTVIEDQPNRIILFLQAGSACKWTYIDFERGFVGTPVDKVWRHTNVLQIIERDAAHAIWVMWASDSGRFVGWYINLQAPVIRVPDGLVSWDQSLDIVVSPSLEWTWKDEDHFERIQELGWLSKEEAEKIRAEGERVIKRIEARMTPFNESWPDWRPDANWPLPSLPENWAEIPQAVIQRNRG